MMRQKRWIAILLAGVAVLALSGCGSQSAGTAGSAASAMSSEAGATSTGERAVLQVTLGGKEDGQPYIYTENGEPKGFEPELWKEIARRENLEITYKYNSISSLFGMLDNGEIDTVTHFIGKTAERQQKYQFSDSYGYATLQLMVAEDADEITGVDQLKGKKVAVALGSASAGVLDTMNTDNSIEVVPYEEFRSIPEDVELGRVDAYLGNTITMKGDIASMGLTCKINPLVIQATEVAYPYLESNETAVELMKRVNEAIAEMKADGTIKALSEQWLGVDITVSE